jgi:hypothetical protein
MKAQVYSIFRLYAAVDAVVDKVNFEVPTANESRLIFSVFTSYEFTTNAKIKTINFVPSFMPELYTLLTTNKVN